MADHLVLIDGHHLMYRAYWAIPRTLTTKAGEQVNAVFGVASMVLTILRQEQPTHFLFCFDAGEETFRHAEAVDYKEGRAETPDDFYVQIPRILELVDAGGWQQVSEPKYEADDFLCTYAKAGEAAGMKVTIVTGDRDALQLATAATRIAIPHKGYQAAEYLGPEEILAKYGVRPDQVAAYKGLIGDSSDNLRGVKGIGPKTAADLLQKYDTLESLYEHLDEVRPAVRAKLEADRESAFFCQRMARLVSDIPLPHSLDQLRLADIDPTRLETLFAALEFKVLTRRLEELLTTPYGQSVFQPSHTTKPIQKPSSPDSQLSLFAE
jgi:DNA polymerase-1